ncbi:MAG: septal ring lytic transglycosylase RlpA family protein [Casimicrobiaceae bacterium]
MTANHPDRRARAWLSHAAVAWIGICAAAGVAMPGAALAAGPSQTTGDGASGGPGAGKHTQFGIASVYARMLDGRPTASGELHDSDELVAAHRTLPLGTEVRVTNLANHRTVVVRINDRGPQPKSRIIDLSPRAGAAIGLRAKGKGITRVRIDVLRVPDGPAATSREPAGGADKPGTARATS